MIVKCEQCQTRFKIPDDKVTDKGVKVRCTKCGHTFRVTRDMAQPATGVNPAVGASPTASTAQVPAFQMPMATQPAMAAPDPFSRFGAAEDPNNVEVTRPGVFALGVEASRSPDLGRAPPPTQPSMPAVGGGGGAFDFNSLRPPASSAPTVPAVPAYVPPPASTPAPSPFDFAAIAPPSAPAPSQAFDFSSFASPAAAVPAPPPPPMPSVPPAPTSHAYDFGSPTSAVAAPPPPSSAFDFSAPSTALNAPLPASAPAFPAPPPPAFPTSGGGQYGDGAPSAQSAFGAPAGYGDAAGGADGFFGGVTQPELGAASAMDTATARSMFDMPSAPAVPSTLPDIPPPEPDPVPAPVAAAPAVAPVAIGAMKPRVADEPAEAPRRKNIVGVVVNIAIAAVLVVGLLVVFAVFSNEGTFSAATVTETLKNLFAPEVDFVAGDVSNGLYETRAGRSVFFVRGEVTNRSQGAVKVVVKAELVEGDKVVRFAEAWAGEPATPEEIHLIDGSDALEQLNRKVEKRALVVPPDSSAAFVVPFTEYPPELSGFRVRVTARAVPSGATAANP